MKKRITALALSGVLLLSGCGGSDPGPETKPTEPVSTVTATETTAPTQTVPQETETVIADDALSLLRADMKPHMAALGYLGYCDLENYDSPMSYLQGEFPNYLASKAYLSGIDRVYGNYGSLYCVVPRDPNARVTINHVKFEGMYAGGSLLCEDLAGGSAFIWKCPYYTDGRSGGLPCPGGDGDPGEGCGLLVAFGRKGTEAGSCGDGQSLYHDHRGCFVPFGLFPLCQGAASCIS